MEPNAIVLLLACACSLFGTGLTQEQCEVAARPVACFPPDTRNAVAGLTPETSNTCGLAGPERVCYQVGAGGMLAGTCEFCDAADPARAHPAALMTDPHSPAAGPPTFWQSQNYSVVQYPNSVVITFPFNKTFSVRSVAIIFQTSRPESFSLYKSLDYGASFSPFHYFSLSCNQTYGLEEGTSVAQGEEAVPLCTSREARLTPLSGGEAVFLPLEHRPSAAMFSSSLQLQEWARTTQLQLRLDRLNTFGDETLTFDPMVLDSYYYAISNVEVLGQCWCNGHASRCLQEEVGGVLTCDCQHGTTGPDCEQCLPFYQDRPWAPATANDSAACASCRCNNHSSECHFDAQRYEASGMVSGGVCDSCQHNTTGPNCERCLVDFYPNPQADFTSPEACLSCDCDPRGTEGEDASCLSSTLSGQCSCKGNVQGRRCEECVDSYYGLDIGNPDGCIVCDCSAAGTINSTQTCHKSTGQCPCKTGVEGRDCAQCSPGYYDLTPLNEDGCLPCMCSVGGAVSAVCDAITGDCLCRSNISGHQQDDEGRSVLDCSQPDPRHYCPGLALVWEAEGEEVAGAMLEQGSGEEVFTGSGFVLLEEGEEVEVKDLILPFSGLYDLYVRHQILSEIQSINVNIVAMTTNPLPLDPSLPCSPNSGEFEWTVFLSPNSSFSPLPSSACLLSNTPYSLHLTAESGPLLVDSVIATPTLHEGAEQLEVFQDDNILQSYLSQDCPINHLEAGGDSQPDSDFCASTTCSAMFELFDGAPSCDCDPVGSTSADCSSYHGNCPCRPGFTGRRCDLCTPGKGGQECEDCNCNSIGSLTSTCDRDGQCICQPGVGGATCQTCLSGYYNLTAEGCVECGCDEVGSEGVDCNDLGQCACREGVSGERCAVCQEGYSNLTNIGCSKCDCNLEGSQSPLCDPLTGVCLCRDNLIGPRCDMCNCSGNSDLCDLSTGVCTNCKNNTFGDSCEQCLPGYYGNAVGGACSPCPCPLPNPLYLFANSCQPLEDGEVVCVGCREGFAGDNCEDCTDDYVGDPTGDLTGSPLPCIPCDCNGNTDPVAGESCDLQTGVCFGCLGNTAGDHCERCAPGFEGDAIIAKNCTECPEDYYWLPNATCTLCGCHPNGSVDSECEEVTGKCECVPGARGDKCSVCTDGFHMIEQGCVACPDCYDVVAVELNLTISLYSDLLSQINSSLLSNSSLPSSLLEDLLSYHTLLQGLLESALDLVQREQDLREGVESVAMETDELELVVNEFGANVSEAEDRLLQVVGGANSTSGLLQLLQTIVSDLETAVRVTLRGRLEEALRLNQAIMAEFTRLVSLAEMANQTSHEQLSLVLSLLADAEAASTDAAEALRLLCEALDLQNGTTAAIEALEQEELPPLEDLYSAAQQALDMAEADVPQALAQARAALQAILSLPIHQLNISSLEQRLLALHSGREALELRIGETEAELGQLEEETARLAAQATHLINESRRLNGIALDLLGRAHAALSLATYSTEEGNEFIAMVEDLLRQLRGRLNDTLGVVEGLEEVAMNVRKAEEASGQAEEEAERKGREVREAARLAAEAAHTLEEAGNITGQALELALNVSGEAEAVLIRARELRSGSEALEEGLREEEDRMEMLEAAAQEDTEAIAMATNQAEAVTTDAQSLQETIQELSEEVDVLSVQLNNTELVPARRLQDVGSKVTEFEQQAEENQDIIDTLQEQVQQLEESAAQLRGQHVSLQQHRDLLQNILSNVRELDCRSQFQSIG